MVVACWKKTKQKVTRLCFYMSKDKWESLNCKYKKQKFDKKCLKVTMKTLAERQTFAESVLD